MVARGIYAPIINPTAVENTVFILAIVESLDTNEHIKTVKRTDDTDENSKVATIVRKSTKVIKNSPIQARYTRHTSRNIKQIITVTMILKKK